MFQVGDIVIYGMTGACQITNITAKNLAGADGNRLYYTLKPLYQQCIIHIPVNNDKILMRPVVSRDEAERLIALIPSIQAEPYYSKAARDLAAHYSETIRACNCGDLIELTMSIYAKKVEIQDQKRKFGAVDERFLHQAEDLLFGELAAALGISREEVPAYIAAKVEA